MTNATFIFNCGCCVSASLPVSVWAFIQQSEDMRINYSNLPVGVNVSVNVCLYVSDCDCLEGWILFFAHYQLGSAPAPFNVTFLQYDEMLTFL